MSEIIDVLNERFGTEFEEADRLFFEQIEAELMEDATLHTDHVLIRDGAAPVTLTTTQSL